MNKLALLILSCLTAELVFANKYYENGITWQYTVVDGYAYVGKEYDAYATGASGAVTVPANMGGYPVKTVSGTAFYKCTSVTSVTYSEGIEEAWVYGGNSRFPKLSFVKLPSSMKHFENSTGYVSAFVVDSANPYYSTAAGALYNKDFTKLVRYPYDTNEFNVTNSVREICDFALYNCDNLKSINLPEAVRNIGDSSLGCCDSLASITIPEGTTNISQRAFEYCAALEEISLPSALKNVGREVFSGCSKLKSIELPDNLIELSQRM